MLIKGINMNVFSKILCSALLLVMCGEAKAASYQYSMQKCQALAQGNPAKIKIFYNYGELKYNNDKSAAELGKIYDEIMPNHSSRNIRGLTLLAPHMDFNIHIKDVNVDGYKCFYPQSIDLHLKYNPTIYLVNTMQEGSCLYDLTLRHEYTHLDIGHQLLTEFAQNLEFQIRQVIENTGVRLVAEAGSNVRQEGAELNALYQEQIKVFFHHFTDELVKRNQLIDTKENYKEESVLCPKAN